jgi:predicted AAA+ superfamily ATPase
VSYWRERNYEVDFVINRRKTVIAVEVKSGRRQESFAGIDAFGKQFRPKLKLVIGSQGVPLSEFLSKAPLYWFSVA